MQRLALLLRSLWAVYAITMIAMAAIGAGGITWPFLIAWATVVAWETLFAASYFRRQGLSAGIAELDVGGGVALLTLGSTLLPHVLLGDGSTWVVLGGSLSAFVAIWTLSGALAFGSTVLLGTSYLAGIYLASHSLADVDQLQTIAYQVSGWIVVAVLTWILRRSADQVDSTLRDLGLARQTYQAERARLDHREARDRLFHDQVLAVLGMVANNGLVGQFGALQNRCGRALAWMHELEAGRYLSGRVATSAPFAEVVAEIRDLGLDVAFDERGAEGALTELDPSGIGADVMNAMIEAMRQALLNVWRHAGVSAARVSITRACGMLTVVVEDNGKGFDPQNIRPGARGVRNSIEGHVRDIGGTVEIRSAPGCGCTIRLAYRADGSQAAIRQAPAEAGIPGGLVRHAFDASVARAIAVVAFGWHLVSLSFLLTHLDGYTAPDAVIAVWVAMLLAEIFLFARAGQASGRKVAAYGSTALIAGGAIAVLFLCKISGILGYENWGLGDAGFMLAYLITYHELRVLALGVAAVGLANIAMVAARIGPALDMGSPADSLAKVAGVFLGSAAITAGEVAVYRMLRKNAEIVGCAREDIDRTAAMRQAADRIAKDRATMYAKTDNLVRPILQEIADGIVDPDSPPFRRRCGLAESAVRRTYVADWDSRMSRELMAFSESAADLGVIVELNYNAGLFAPSASVLRSISAYLVGMLAHSRPGRATLLVLPDCDLVATKSESESDQKRAYGLSTISFYLPVNPARSAQLARFLADASSDGNHKLEVDYEMDVDNDQSLEGGAYAWLALSGKL